MLSARLCHLTLLPAAELMLAVVGCAQAQAPAAEQVRRPTFARVVDEHGAAIANAVVTFVGGHPHLARSLQEPDVLEVATDERGRAVAKLLADRCYVAWSVGPIEPDGQRLQSQPHGFFAAGGLFELRCASSAPVQTCTLSGRDAWQHLGPLGCFAMTSIPGRECELERDAAGRFVMPGGPFDAFEVRSADGQPLWHQRYEDELTLPPPQSVRVRAVDEAGKPLVGAEVLHRVGQLSSWRLDGLRGVGEDRMRVLGVTDEQGVCTVQVPYDGNPLHAARDNLLLFVAGAGRPAVAGGVWSRALYVSDHKVAEIDGDELRFECPPAEPLSGVMPSAPPGTVAHLAAVCKLFLQRNSYLHDARVFTAPVGADGGFTFPDVPAELHSCRLSFVPPGGSDWQPPVFAPEASRALPFEVAPLDAAKSVPLVVGTVSLEVVDPRGGPARGAIAFVSSGDRQGVLLRDSLIRAPLDARGAARLRLVPGRWVVVVVTEQGFGARELAVEGGDTQATLKLAPLSTTTITLRGADGLPIPGARIRSRGTTTRGTNDPVHSILQGLRRQNHVHWDRLSTDDDGRVVVPFVPVEGLQQRLELRWDGGVSEEFTLEPDAELSVSENR